MLSPVCVSYGWRPGRLGRGFSADTRRDSSRPEGAGARGGATVSRTPEVYRVSGAGGPGRPRSPSAPDERGPWFPKAAHHPACRLTAGFRGPAARPPHPAFWTGPGLQARFPRLARPAPDVLCRARPGPRLGLGCVRGGSPARPRVDRGRPGRPRCRGVSGGSKGREKGPEVERLRGCRSGAARMGRADQGHARRRRSLAARV